MDSIFRFRLEPTSRVVDAQPQQAPSKRNPRPHKPKSSSEDHDDEEETQKHELDEHA